MDFQLHCADSVFVGSVPVSEKGDILAVPIWNSVQVRVGLGWHVMELSQAYG